MTYGFSKGKVKEANHPPFGLRKSDEKGGWLVPIPLILFFNDFMHQGNSLQIPPSENFGHFQGGDLYKIQNRATI